MDELTVNVDGASRGNPGRAAYAAVFSHGGQEFLDCAGILPHATNNVAEYSALILALKRASELGVKKLHVLSDSELMVKQMRGKYRVKHPDLIPLYERAQSLAKTMTVAIDYVPRAQNAAADKLCNHVLDGKTPPTEAEPVASPVIRKASSPAPTTGDLDSRLTNLVQTLKAGDMDLDDAPLAIRKAFIGAGWTPPPARSTMS